MAQCKARSKRSGKQCRREAAPGATVCASHGASAPQVRAAAQRRLIAMEAATQVQAWGGRLDVTPPEALMELVQTKAAEVAYWQWRVSDLTEDGRAGLLVTKTEEGYTADGDIDTTTRQAAPHVYLTLLHKAQDQLAMYAAAAIKAGVDQRMVELATMQAAWQLPLLLRVVELARADPGMSDRDVVRLVIEGADR